jgi:hypothetical protein
MNKIPPAAWDYISFVIGQTYGYACMWEVLAKALEEVNPDASALDYALRVRELAQQACRIRTPF